MSYEGVMGPDDWTNGEIEMSYDGVMVPNEWTNGEI
jgi:hypothetical protein